MLAAQGVAMTGQSNWCITLCSKTAVQDGDAHTVDDPIILHEMIRRQHRVNLLTVLSSIVFTASVVALPEDLF
jgi:hypothetical protein